jgi:hypothetical protein
MTGYFTKYLLKNKHKLLPSKLKDNYKSKNRDRMAGVLSLTVVVRFLKDWLNYTQNMDSIFLT